MKPNGFSPSYRALAVAGVLSVLALTGCGNDKDKKAQAGAAGGAAGQQMPAPTVGVQVVRLTTLPIASLASGRTVAAEVSEVRPQISGIVEEILFQEGAPVKAGQPLYRINPDNYSSGMASSEAALGQAQANVGTAKASLLAQQANLDLAQANLERYKELLKVDAISRQAYDQAITAVKTARAGVEQAKAGLAAAEAGVYSAKASIDNNRLNMERTIVRAPISGKSGISSVTKGALVSAGQATPLVRISRFDPMFVDISQSSSDILRLREAFRSGTASRGDLEVELVLEDGSIYPIKGRLILDNGQVNESTGAITLRAVFDNPEGSLLPGMFVNARINQSVVENAMLVPQDALIRTPQGQTQVYVVEDKKIALREVTISGSYNGQWVVTGGLKDGEQLVVMGANKVKPEQAVEVQVLPPAGAGSENAQVSEPEESNAPKAGTNSVLKPASDDKPVTPQIAPRENKADDGAANEKKPNESSTDKVGQSDGKSENASKSDGKSDSVKSDAKKSDETQLETKTGGDDDLEKQMMDAADDNAEHNKKAN